MSDDVANHTLALLRRMDQRIEHLDQRVEHLGQTVERMDRKLDQVVDRLGHIERGAVRDRSWLQGLDEGLLGKQDQLDHFGHRLQALEEKVERLTP